MQTVKSALEVLDLGRRAYNPVKDLQDSLVEKRKRNAIPDTLILVEHDPVYTLGRNATDSNITASAGDLARMGIEVVRTSRGGQVTYHGPGQIVGYPIVDLAGLKLTLTGYIGNLEEVIIRTLAEFGLSGARDSANRGVWIGNDKIAAIGVRVTGGVAMHGFAFNVSTDLNHYKGMIPCGIKGRWVTSLRVLGCEVPVDEVKKTVVKKFCEVFSYENVIYG